MQTFKTSPWLAVRVVNSKKSLINYTKMHFSVTVLKMPYRMYSRLNVSALRRIKAGVLFSQCKFVMCST